MANPWKTDIAGQDYWNNFYKNAGYDDDESREFYNNLWEGSDPQSVIDRYTQSVNAWDNWQHFGDITDDYKNRNERARRAQQMADMYNGGKAFYDPETGRITDRRAYNKVRDAVKADSDRYYSNGNSDWTDDTYKKMLNIQNQYNDYVNQRRAIEAKKAANEKQIRDTRESTIADVEAAGKNAYTQARNQGLGSNLAASIGSMNLGDTTANAYQGNYGALSNAKTSTQNDYLQKLGYANALDQQAKNQEAGSFLNIMGSALGGAGSGAQIGASLGSMGGK